MQETPTTLETRGDPDLTGQELGDYRVLRRLGRGGMAEVYLAEQVSLGRQVALKVLKRDLASDESYVRRFHHEARAAAALVHANIVQIYEVGRLEELHCIAQEYVCGQNLKQLLARRSEPVNAALAVTIMRQVAAALHKAAAGGIVHRDIKPENIMITREGEVKVADFGLARLTGQGLDITQVGVTMGTPLYMSPEQVHGAKLDQRSDLYSLGVTCFHMLAGEPPFRGETAMSVAIKHLQEKPPRLRDRRPDLPPALCQLVHKLMAKDPEKRYPNAAAALKDVKQIQSALKQDVDPKSLSLSGFDMNLDEETAGLSWGQKIALWSVKKKVAVYAIICLVIAGASASLGWWSKPKNPLEQPAPTQPKITIMQSAAEQYNLALRSLPNDEDAWKAVLQHDDKDKLYHYRAMEQLGLLYLRKLKLEQASEVFDKMSELEGGRLEQEFRIKAIAGQAVIADLQGDVEKSKTLVNNLPTGPGIDLRGPLRDYIAEMESRWAQDAPAEPDS